jgi:regulator of sigma E protease
MIVAVIAFIILLMILVTAHEFGHFYLARKAGVTVHEFAVGM